MENGQFIGLVAFNRTEEARAVDVRLFGAGQGFFGERRFALYGRGEHDSCRVYGGPAGLLKGGK